MFRIGLEDFILNHGQYQGKYAQKSYNPLTNPLSSTWELIIANRLNSKLFLLRNILKVKEDPEVSKYAEKKQFEMITTN